MSHHERYECYTESSALAAVLTACVHTKTLLRRTRSWPEKNFAGGCAIEDIKEDHAAEAGFIDRAADEQRRRIFSLVWSKKNERGRHCP